MARGRRPRADVRSTERVGTFLTESEREDLLEVARENGQSVAAVLREAVNEYVADYRERRIFRSKNSRQG